jgi:hypothetical protein
MYAVLKIDFLLVFVEKISLLPSRNIGLIILLALIATHTPILFK